MAASYKLKDVRHETRNFWVLDVGAKGFEVYRSGPTASTRCAIIGYIGPEGLRRAIAECERRQQAEDAAFDVRAASLHPSIKEPAP